METLPFFFKYLLNPTGKTIDFFNKIRNQFNETVNFLEEIDKSRVSGHCKLITKDNVSKNNDNSKHNFLGKITITCELQLYSIMPENILQYLINVADIKDDNLRESLSKMVPKLAKVTNEVDEFIKKYKTILDSLNGKYIEEVDVAFIRELVALFCNYVNEIGHILKYGKDIQKRSKHKHQLESIGKFSSNINVSLNVSTNETTRNFS